MSEVSYDYTNGRVFTGSNITITNFFLDLGIKFPWDSIFKLKPVFSDSGLETEESILFPTGTSHDIKYREMINGLEQGSVCERCGDKIDIIPWDCRTYMGLCNRCNIDLDKDYGPDLFGIYPKREVEEIWWL